MRLTDLLRSRSRPDADVSAAGEQEHDRPRGVLLQPLPGGFGLRHPDTRAALQWDGDPYLQSIGARVVRPEVSAEHLDAFRSSACEPGQPVELVAYGASIGCWTADRSQEIGRIPVERAATLATTLRTGRRLRGTVIWEARTADGMRTDLRILITPSDVELVVHLPDHHVQLP